MYTNESINKAMQLAKKREIELQDVPVSDCFNL